MVLRLAHGWERFRADLEDPRLESPHTRRLPPRMMANIGNDGFFRVILFHFREHWDNLWTGDGGGRKSDSQKERRKESTATNSGLGPSDDHEG